MNCESMEELLSAYIDGEVTNEERQLIEQHIASCASCHTVLQDLSAIQAFSRMLPVVDAPQGFRQRVNTKIEQPSRAWFIPKWFVPRWAIGLAALLFFSVGVLFWYLQQTPENQAKQYAASIDVYAEDILFGELNSTATEGLSYSETTNVAEEILDQINIEMDETQEPVSQIVSFNNPIA